MDQPKSKTCKFIYGDSCSSCPHCDEDVMFCEKQKQYKKLLRSKVWQRNQTNQNQT